MIRTLTTSVAIGLVCCCALMAWGDDKSTARDVLAMENEIQTTIREAEPAVVSVLVSRSEVYENKAPIDDPGRLGAFESDKIRLPPGAVPPNNFRGGPWRGGRFHEQIVQREKQKYDLSEPDSVPESFGSGVVIDGQELLVLTNYHVVIDATKVYVRLPGGRGSYANIHAADPRSDLAVLQLLDRSLRPLKEIKFGDGGNVVKGQFVLSLSNAYAAGFSDGSPSASWGMLSNIRRTAASSPREEDQRALHRYGTLLQSDCRLNVGCSGGALLNRQGEMIGLTTARAALAGSESSGGFAIPMDSNFRRIISKLKDGFEVEYGFLGVRPAPRVPGGHEEGVMISDRDQNGVTPGSPASVAQLVPGDRILSINGIRLQNNEDLFVTVATLLAGTEARLEIKDRKDIATVTLAKTHVPGKIIASKRPPGFRGLRVDYTSVLTTLRQEDGGFVPWGQGPSPVLPGVFVREIQPNSRAASARPPLQEGKDVITAIYTAPGETNKVRHEVKDPSDFYREIGRIGPNEPVELELYSSTGRDTPRVRID